MAFHAAVVVHTHQFSTVCYRQGMVGDRGSHELKVRHVG